MKSDLPRKLFLLLMIPGSAWECVITVMLFAFPEFEGRQFHAPVTPETIFSSNLLGGFMILFSTLCGLCTWQVHRGDPNGRLLAKLIGVFWIYMGFGLYQHVGAPSYVLLDSVRGAVVLGLAFALPKNTATN